MDSTRTIGLALSGGGFRASLFHLAVLKRLHELKILDQVTHISCVSGGAVVGALYVYLKKQKGAEFKFSDLEQQLLEFVKRNPRDWWLVVTVIRRILMWLLPLSIRLPLDRSLRAMTIDRSFNRLFSKQKLAYLKPEPKGESKTDIPLLIINTTSLERGQNFYFTPTYIGPRGEAAMAMATPMPPPRTGPERISLAEAVGASACFPVVFPPFVLPVNPDETDDGTQITGGLELRQTHLVDGGVYDNQGFGVFLTEAFEEKERVQYLISSDASKTLQSTAKPIPGLLTLLKRLRTLMRVHQVTEDRARWEQFGLLLYKRRTRDLNQVALLHTDTTLFEEQPFTLPKSITYRLARLRTDFDSFSNLEIAALMYHGYTLINHRIFNFCFDLLPTELTRKNPTLFPDMSTWSLHQIREKKKITWEQVNRAIPNLSSEVAPLKTWSEFANGITEALPTPSPLTVRVLSWIEKPWRPYLNESNPTAARDPLAREAAEIHLLRGATNLSVWRGLQRLGDRGKIWRFGVLICQILIAIVGLYALQKALELLVVPMLNAVIALLDVVWSVLLCMLSTVNEDGR